MSKLNKELEDLIATFKSLRNPDTGCAWDREQTFKSIASCAIEAVSYTHLTLPTI